MNKKESKMPFYKNDKGFLSQTPAAAGDADAVQWAEVDKAHVVFEFNKMKQDLESAARQLTELSDRAAARQNKLNQIEEYVQEAAKEGNDAIDIQQFADEFGFSLEVVREFSMTIKVTGTVEFDPTDEPDLSDFSLAVDLSSYYSTQVDVDVSDSSIEEWRWED